MKVQICTGKNCREKYSKYLTERLKRDTSYFQWSPAPEIEDCFCLGKCKLAPNVSIDGEIQSYMTPIKLSEMLQRKLLSHR